MAARRRIIIDTDPGQDDAVAILLALASPDDIDVLGIVAVAGNVPLARTADNARRIVALAGRADVPVYAGAERPLVRDLTTAEHVHGKTGLDGYALPESEMALASGHGVDFIVDTLMNAEQQGLWAKSFQATLGKSGAKTPPPPDMDECP